MAGLAELCLSGSSATRTFVSAIPWAVWGPPGARGKLSSIDVISSEPVGAYLVIRETTVGGLRSARGTR